MPSNVISTLDPGGSLKGNNITYVIEEEISQGSFGVLYKAKVKGSEQFVAIKEWNPLEEVDNDKKQSMLSNEIRVLQNVGNALKPHVPALKEYFSFNEHDYLVMDFVNGITLDEWLQRQENGHLSRADMAGLISRIARTLFGMHQWSYFHGDISPKNIMITSGTSNGEIEFCIIDFGFGVCLEDGQESVPKVNFGSTPGYVDPQRRTPCTYENIEGVDTQLKKLREYMLARDFYGIVAIAYFLVKGKRPIPTELDLDGIENPAKDFFANYLVENHVDILTAINAPDKLPFEVETDVLLRGIGKNVSEGSDNKQSDDAKGNNERPESSLAEQDSRSTADANKANGNNASNQETDVQQGHAIAGSNDVNLQKENTKSALDELLRQAKKKLPLFLSAALVAGLLYYSVPYISEYIEYIKKPNKEQIDFPPEPEGKSAHQQEEANKVSETEICTQMFADFHEGKISRDKVCSLFTLDSYFLVRKGELLVGSSSDPLYSVNQLLNEDFEPDYKIGSDYKVVHVEREAESGLIRRIIIEKI